MENVEMGKGRKGGREEGWKIAGLEDCGVGWIRSSEAIRS
jgi:hypothetical protein